MKKLIFSALAVVALVGSALAFNQTDKLFFDNPSVPGADCLLQVNFRTITPTAIPLGVQQYGTVSSATPCPLSAQIYQSN